MIIQLTSREFAVRDFFLTMFTILCSDKICSITNKLDFDWNSAIVGIIQYSKKIHYMTAASVMMKQKLLYFLYALL